MPLYDQFSWLNAPLMAQRPWQLFFAERARNEKNLLLYLISQKGGCAPRGRSFNVFLHKTWKIRVKVYVLTEADQTKPMALACVMTRKAEIIYWKSQFWRVVIDSSGKVNLLFFLKIQPQQAHKISESCCRKNKKIKLAVNVCEWLKFMQTLLISIIKECLYGGAELRVSV